MRTTASQDVASIIRAEMARRRLSQREVASALGASQPAISRRLNGDVPFDVDELAALAELLQLPVRDLLPESA